MNTLKILKKYVIESQIYVSVCAAFLATFFMLEQNTFRFPQIALLFITFFNGYLFIKFQYREFLDKILIFNALSFVICCIILLQFFYLITAIHWILIMILGLLYQTIFFKLKIRRVPLIKIFHVALVWSLTICWIGIVDYKITHFYIIFLFIAGLTIPFDIRDIPLDQMLTFPKVLGIQKTKFLAYLFIFSSCLICILEMPFLFSLAMLLTTGITFLLIYFANKHQPDYYFTLGLETCSALPILLLYFIETCTITA